MCMEMCDVGSGLVDAARSTRGAQDLKNTDICGTRGAQILGAQKSESRIHNTTRKGSAQVTQAQNCEECCCEVREWHGLPWGFSGQPVPVPVRTRMGSKCRFTCVRSTLPCPRHSTRIQADPGGSRRIQVEW